MKKGLLFFFIFLLLFSFVSCKFDINENDKSIDKTTDLIQENMDEQAPLSKEKDIQSTFFEEGSVTLDYFYKGDFASTILEDEQFIYFGKTDGVWKQNKEDGKADLLYAVKNPNSLLLAEGWLYFVAAEDTQIFRIAPNGGEAELVFDGSKNIPPKHSSTVWVFDYQVSNDVLYVFNAALSFAYDIEAQVFLDCMPNDYASAWQLKGETIYYISHVQDTFTLYSYNLSNKETSVVLGENVVEPSENIYYNFYMTEDELYLCQRLPQGLYRITQDEETILSDRYIYKLFVIDDVLYYLTEDSALVSYDPTAQKKPSYVKLEGCQYSQGVAVVNGYVYYCSDSNAENETTQPCAKRIK